MHIPICMCLWLGTTVPWCAMPHQGPQISVPGTHNSSMFQLVLRSMKVIRSLNTLESSGWTYSLPGCRSEGFWNISKSREHSHKKTYFYSLPSERIFYLYIYIYIYVCSWDSFLGSKQPHTWHLKLHCNCSPRPLLKNLWLWWDLPLCKLQSFGQHFGMRGRQPMSTVSTSSCKIVRQSNIPLACIRGEQARGTAGWCKIKSSYLAVHISRVHCRTNTIQQQHQTLAKQAWATRSLGVSAEANKVQPAGLAQINPWHIDWLSIVSSCTHRNTRMCWNSWYSQANEKENCGLRLVIASPQMHGSCPQSRMNHKALP